MVGANRVVAHRLGRLLPAVLLAAAACLPAQAQVQRSFINLGFESPNLETEGCRVYIGDDFVPGWVTTHPPFQQENVGGCVVPPGFVVGTPAPIIELWKTPRSGVIARSGTQLAELNAEVVSRLSQNVCLVNGEQITWNFSHRGRNSATVQDVSRFLIGPAPIVEVGTTNNGAGGVITTFQGASNSVLGPNGWRDYSGSFTYVGASGVTNIGFESISAAGGATQGNFIDDIQVTLLPFLELAGGDFVSVEGSTNGLPVLRVLGVVGADMLVTVGVTGGTAVLGSDFTTPGGGASFTVTVPAGSYEVPFEIPLGLASIDNSAVEDNRTVQLEVQPSPGLYTLASTTLCGGVPDTTSQWTIVDDDVDLLTTKATSNAVPLAGETFEYTVTFANNTARPTVAPIDGHDVNAEVADAVPAGLTFDSWICQAANGGSCPGGAVNGSTNGSGPITGTAFLPAGDAAAGGTLVYTVQATLDDPAPGCAAITNTSSIVTPPGFNEGTLAAPGFTTPAPGGLANNDASVDITPACADLAITKVSSADPVTSGQQVTYTMVVVNNGPGAADGSVVADPVVAGLDCAAGPLTCGAIGGAVCPAALDVAQFQAAGLVIPTLPNGGSLSFELTCTVTASGD